MKALTLILVLLVETLGFTWQDRPALNMRGLQSLNRVESGAVMNRRAFWKAAAGTAGVAAVATKGEAFAAPGVRLNTALSVHQPTRDAMLRMEDRSGHVLTLFMRDGRLVAQSDKHGEFQWSQVIAGV